MFHEDHYIPLQDPSKNSPNISVGFMENQEQNDKNQANTFLCMEIVVFHTDVDKNIAGFRKT